MEPRVHRWEHNCIPTIPTRQTNCSPKSISPVTTTKTYIRVHLCHRLRLLCVLCPINGPEKTKRRHNILGLGALLPLHNWRWPLPLPLRIPPWISNLWLVFHCWHYTGCHSMGILVFDLHLQMLQASCCTSPKPPIFRFHPITLITTLRKESV